MSDGLKATFALLAETHNEAANRVLVPALDCRYRSVREAALTALLLRPGAAEHREVISRLHAFETSTWEVLEHYHDNMTASLREAMLGKERRMCINACTAATWFREYDLIPAILAAMEDSANANADVLGKTLLDLVDQLCAELAGPREYGKQRDPQLIRRQVVGALEASVARFGRHRRRETIEAFALLVYRDNITLKQLVQDPHHAAFVAIVELLAKSRQGPVIGLLLSFLDDPHAPSAPISIIAKRSDLRFLEFFLRKVERDPAPAVLQNLKRIESIQWTNEDVDLLDHLDDSSQQAAVRLVMAAGIPRQQAFSVVEYLLEHGKAAGRRAAAEALEQFSGVAANSLAMRHLEDTDPEVQSKLLGQLRRRGIPGAVTRLIDMLDSPHAVVCAAAQKALPEFNFQRLVGTFDALDEELRLRTASLVKKVDPQAISQLRTELSSWIRLRRLRGLTIARLMEVIPEVEDLVIPMTEDEDHIIRGEALTTLGLSPSPSAREAIRKALTDSSQIVQDTARRLLGELEPQQQPIPAVTPQTTQGE